MFIVFELSHVGQRGEVTLVHCQRAASVSHCGSDLVVYLPDINKHDLYIYIYIYIYNNFIYVCIYIYI